MADNSTILDAPVPSETLMQVGPILVGALFSWMLFGISSVQLYIYHISFPRERWTIQASVYIIFALDIFQSVVACALAWKTLCSGWGRPVNLQFPGWTFSAIPCVSSIVAAWVQIFYAWRIYQLGKWRVIPCVIIMVALAQLSAANAIGISFVSLKDIVRLHDKRMYARTIIWLGGGAFTDLVITASMVYLLYSAKKRSHTFERSSRMINRLIRITMETGVVCALSAILELGFFLGMPHNNLHLLIALMLSKIYSNTLMTSLNSRAMSSSRRSQCTTTSSIGGSGPSTGALGPRSIEEGLRRAVIHISQHTEVELSPSPRSPRESKVILDLNEMQMLGSLSKNHS
ncbi:hypothetical protein OF83DRAFT_1175947 [Amylostereum chailletii]|nr:hypothetical protein OF83DRAFT_1175947 [Amylostereum chailletii]